MEDFLTLTTTDAFFFSPCCYKVSPPSVTNCLAGVEIVCLRLKNARNSYSLLKLFPKSNIIKSGAKK